MRTMKILITGGSTWIKIDEVRIITNIFTGGTALFLAKEFKKKKHQVTLLINPSRLKEMPSGIQVKTFRFFDELQAKLKTELKDGKYDIIIHSAAVSDYRLKSILRGKLSSGKEKVTLTLVKTAKLIKLIRRLAKQSYLVQFKLETKKNGLVEKAFRSLQENQSDLVVANCLQDIKLGYKAFLIDRDKKIIPVSSRRELSSLLLQSFSKLASC